MFKRAAYASSQEKFLIESNESILGKLTAASSFNVELSQVNAWLKQISILKDQLKDLSQNHIFFETCED